MGDLEDESLPLVNAEGPYKIDQCTFANRLKALYSHWRKHKNGLWRFADFFAISSPPDEISYFKSTMLILWLLGYKFPETTMIFGRKHIYILCNQKYASLLESVKGSAKDAVGVDVVIHSKLEGEDGSFEMDTVLHSMLVSKSKVYDAPIVGYTVKESLGGLILQKWAKKLTKYGFQLSDVTAGISDLFCSSNLSNMKDSVTVLPVEKVAYLTVSAMKYFFIPKIRRSFDMKTEIPGHVISEHARIDVKLNGDNVDINYPSIFASGGKIDIRSVVQSNNDYFVLESPNLIICASGSQFKIYYYVARSYLIDPNAFQITAYKVLLRAYEAAIKVFKYGYKLSDVYPAAHEAVKKDYPMLVPNLTMTVGTHFGVALRQQGLPGNLFNDQIIKVGKGYHISLGFQNVLTGTDNLQTFSLLLGDTLIVGNGEPEVFTRLCSKDVKEVVFFSDNTREALEPEMQIVYNGNGALYSKITLQSGKHETSKKELLRQFQAELARKKSKLSDVYNWSYLTTSNEHIGSRYNNFCSNVARSFLIDPNAPLSKAYTSLSRAHEAATYAVIPGSEVRDVYIAAVAVVQVYAPELLPNLTKTAGTCIGTQFGESGLAMDLNNDHVIKAGMIFKISIGFQDFSSEAGHPKSQVFSLFLEDLVVVTNSGRVVITQLNTKDVKDVIYTFNDAKEELKLRVGVQKRSKIDLGRLRRPWVEFHRQTTELTFRRLAGWSSELIAYKSVKDVPRLSYKSMIGVHFKNEAILLPIHGVIAPFHIATVNRVSTLMDTNDNFYIRIFFNVPGRQFTPCHDEGHGSIYLKEVSYLTRDPDHFRTVVRQFKILKKIIENRESKRAESTMLVVPATVEPLGSKFKPIVLSNLWIHPPFGDEFERKRIGALEAHINGFRYFTSRENRDRHEWVEIMYANIKHAFFQPAENEKEMITLIHFHLHGHVMIGNKKSRDVRFYADVVQTFGGGTYHFSDEIEERKRAINMDFQKFVNNLMPQFKELGLEFEQPLKKLGFHGVPCPYNSKAFIAPTSSCLVGLIETPFLVITLSEIEIVNLERFGQKDFDMAIVFSDFERDVMVIDSIPSTSFDGITEWLDSADIKYYVNKRNRNWNAILEAFCDDPQVFEEVGGWDFLKQEAASDSATDTDTNDEYESESSDSEDFNDEEDSSHRLPVWDLGVLGKFRSVLYHV